MKRTFPFFLSALLLSMTVAFSSCEDEDVPPAENEEEIITSLTLTFTPTDGGQARTFTYTDLEGPEVPTIEPIMLAPNTPYTLTLSLAGPDGDDMTSEIEAEGDEHLFFFGWADALFTSPEGSGNLISRNGTVLYDDEDSQGQPIGLRTSWTTGESGTSGNFTTVLKHQPGIKSATSSATEGETDIEIVWDMQIQ